MEKSPMISVIICTRDRAESLRITLECLERAMQPGIGAEVIVVDNGSRDRTREVVESFIARLPVVYLYEAQTGNYGKSHGLNRALDYGCKGDIIAVLDDDMSPEEGWFEGVADICGRWPDKDLFAGRSYVIWPEQHVPGWACDPAIRGWIFSVQGFGAGDTPLSSGSWYSGNQFWFRARVLADGRRFRDIQLITDADFQLDLVEAGYSGVANPAAAAGHRVQPSLLDEKVVLQRAEQTGVYFARLRLDPYRRHIKQARLLADHPLAGRLFCLLNYVRWRILLGAAGLIRSSDRRFVRRVVATERSATYRELLRLAGCMEEYSVAARWPALRFWRKA
jgi:glycosyltransferase involved in cell wall biosynthesis